MIFIFNYLNLFTYHRYLLCQPTFYGTHHKSVFFKAFIRSIVTIKGMPISSMLWLYRLLFVNDWNAYNWKCAVWLLESWWRTHRPFSSQGNWTGGQLTIRLIQHSLSESKSGGNNTTSISHHQYGTRIIVVVSNYVTSRVRLSLWQHYAFVLNLDFFYIFSKARVEAAQLW